MSRIGYPIEEPYDDGVSADDYCPQCGELTQPVVMPEICPKIVQFMRCIKCGWTSDEVGDDASEEVTKRIPGTPVDMRILL